VRCIYNTTDGLLEEKLERKNLNGYDVFSSFIHEARVGYGPIFPLRTPGPGPQDQVGLTVAGLMHVPAADTLVLATLKLISNLGIYRNNIELDPFDAERPKAYRDSVLGGGLGFSPHLSALPSLLGKEPSAYHCVFEPSLDTWEYVSLSPEVRRFAGVSSVDEYLERLGTLLGHIKREDVQTYYSPFTLPASVDYLDAVWRNRFNESLVNPPGVERSARLAFTASSAEEADSRLSALAELLKGLRVPGVSGLNAGHPLGRLSPYLESTLPPETHQRIREAVSLLDAARQIRAGSQHAAAQARSIECFSRLGISYPVYDWPAAWERIRIVAAHAFDSIREEIQAGQA
jgi:hypothetical protein